MPPLSLFYPEWYAIRSWLDYKRHGVYPEPGGLIAQDVRLILGDWPQISARYNLLYKQLEPHLEAEREAQFKRKKRNRDAFNDLVGMGGGGGSFEDLFR